MSSLRVATSTLALSALLLAGTAHASTRPGQTAFKQTGASSGNSGGKRDDHRLGPKDGFPDNHGIENALEHANEHAAFHHGNSPNGDD